jgi:nickel superoxide dismutase
MRTASKFFLLVTLIAFSTNLAYSHCQIPCGIYGDNMRIDMLKEHILTIEKSMNEIKELSKNPSENMNQLVRWINNKDQHADEFTHIVTYYFLNQRIKIVDPGRAGDFKIYQEKLTLLHKMMVFAMKCKQTTDLENTKRLSTLVDKFVAIYFTEEQKAHMKEHTEKK